jgi:hypothetical protein
VLRGYCLSRGDFTGERFRCCAGLNQSIEQLAQQMGKFKDRIQLRWVRRFPVLDQLEVACDGGAT